jgi:hypothetical protein
MHSVATARLHAVPAQREYWTATSRRREPAPSTFTSLSPGEQRIARALYDAQQPAADAGTGRAEPSARSLDDIAKMDRTYNGWNQVFKQLKSEGLIAEQTLGHVVARWTRLRPVRTALAEAFRSAPSPVPSRSA